MGQIYFMKLPFGLCESQYFFQYYMDLNFESLTNAHIITDDILIVGSDLGPLDKHDHDRCLLQLLNQCREVNLKLNATKCIFKAKQVVFYRHFGTYQWFESRSPECTSNLKHASPIKQN